MNKGKEQVGVVIEPKIQIEHPKASKLEWKIVLASAFLIFISIYASIFCLTSSLEIRINQNTIVMQMMFFSLLFSLLFEIKGNVKVIWAILTLLFIVAITIYWVEIKDGFIVTYNTIASYFDEYYQINLIRLTQGSVTATTFFSFLVVLLSFLTSLSVILRRSRFTYLITVLPIAIIPIVVGVIPKGNLLAVLMIAILTVLGTCTSANKVKEAKTYVTIIIILLCSLSGLFLIARVCYSPTRYEREINVQNIKSNIQTRMNDFVRQMRENDSSLANLFKISGSSNGGLSGGKIGQTSDVKFSYEKALEVTVPKDSYNTYYLKSYVGDTYSSKAWKQLEGVNKSRYNMLEKDFINSGISTESMFSYVLEQTQGTAPDKWDVSQTFMHYALSDFSIHNINAGSNRFFTPYYAGIGISRNRNGFITSEVERENNEYSLPVYSRVINNTNNNKILLDPYINPQDLYHYVVTVYKGIQNRDSKLNQYSELEKIYREYAYNYFTSIPNNSCNKLKEFLEDKKLDIASNKSIQNIATNPDEYDENYIESILYGIDTVKNYLFSNTSYSLSPGIVPTDKDFVDYFLFESKVGYCMHYATAATMMFRVMGIPARYVEGYIVTPDDIKKGKSVNPSKSLINYGNTINKVSLDMVQTEILDTNAHAWVEIYINGVGWVPIEVTAGYQENGVTRVPDVIKYPELRNETIKPSQNTLNPNTTKPTSKPTTKPTNTPVPTATQKPGISSSSPLNTQKENTNNSAIKKLLTNLRESKLARLLGAIMLMLLVLIMTIYIRQLVIRKLRDKEFHTEDMNKRIIFIYKELERVLQRYHLKKQQLETHLEFSNRVDEALNVRIDKRMEDVVSIALQASFTPIPASKEDYRIVWEYYRKVHQNLYEENSRIQRLILYYWWII